MSTRLIQYVINCRYWRSINETCEVCNPSRITDHRLVSSRVLSRYKRSTAASKYHEPRDNRNHLRYRVEDRDRDECVESARIIINRFGLTRRTHIQYGQIALFAALAAMSTTVCRPVVEHVGVGLAFRREYTYNHQVPVVIDDAYFHVIATAFCSSIRTVRRRRRFCTIT